MIVTYPACFYVQSDCVIVEFPDLNHLVTQGDDLNDAMAMAIDCLAGYLYDDKEIGIETPKPSNLNDIDPVQYYKQIYVDAPVGECFKSYVSVDVEEYAKLHFNKPVKKTLTIPMWLNRLAIKNNINFSKVLKEALIEKLQLNKQD